MGLRVDMEKLEDGRWQTRYEAYRVGFGLARHTHDRADAYHDIQAVAGRVIVFSDYWWKLLPVGEAWRGFDPAQPHGVTTDEAGAIWVNTTYGKGMPELDTLREDEKHTALDSKCDLPIWIRAQLDAGKTSGYAAMPVLDGVSA